MANADEEARKAYAEAGVEVEEPEAEEETSTEEETEAKSEETEETAKVETEETEDDLEKEPKEPRKRSIYDEYKDKKSEAKTEKERADQAERERDELKEKLEALGTAETVAERSEAQDDIDSFITSHKEWDKEAIADLIELARKGVTPQTDPKIAKDLAEFQAWKAQNADVIERSLFDKEFEAVTPTIKELFPSASADEMKTIKQELDKVSHTTEYHDKDLDYVAFKNKEKLAALVSPKKRGMESKGRKDAELESTDFDPEADLSKMTGKEREAWEDEYHKLTKSESLATDRNGRKLII